MAVPENQKEPLGGSNPGRSNHRQRRRPRGSPGVETAIGIKGEDKKTKGPHNTRAPLADTERNLKAASEGEEEADKTKGQGERNPIGGEGRNAYATTPLGQTNASLHV